MSINKVLCVFIILFFQVVTSVRSVRLVREQICFHLLKRKSRLEPATTAQDIFKQPPPRRTLPVGGVRVPCLGPGPKRARAHVAQQKAAKEDSQISGLSIKIVFLPVSASKVSTVVLRFLVSGPPRATTTARISMRFSSRPGSKETSKKTA